MLLCFYQRSFFKSLGQIITTFLWGGKTPRLRYSLLQKFKFNGDLALPNFLFYYWSAHIHKFIYWLRSPGLLWCRLEAQSLSSSSLRALLSSSLLLNPSGFTSNPAVLSCLRIWCQFMRHFGFVSPSIHVPVTKNDLFPPSLIDSAFMIWCHRGIKHFRDFYKDVVFSTFSDLRSDFDFPASHLFRYFQIRHCSSTLFPNFPSLPTDQPWDDLLTLKLSQKSLISKIYAQLMLFDGHSAVKAQVSWSQELGLDLTDELWDKAVRAVRSSTPCARLGLIQFKVLHRAH